MKSCILLGANSDIAKGLILFLQADGWTIHPWVRGELLPMVQWDLVLCCIGQVAPVGNWWDQQDNDIRQCIESNVVKPVLMLRHLWGRRNAGAAVCFMAGSNPQRVMNGYLAYNTGKMALLKAVEQIDHESPDCTVFALGPGYVKTKIHRATLDAKWPNERIVRGDDGTPIERVYGCLRWCLAQSKKAVGGRNICASDPWDTEPFLAWMLKDQQSLYKLRRVE